MSNSRINIRKNETLLLCCISKHIKTVQIDLLLTRENLIVAHEKSFYVSEDVSMDYHDEMIMLYVNDRSIVDELMFLIIQSIHLNQQRTAEGFPREEKSTRDLKMIFVEHSSDDSIVI